MLAEAKYDEVVPVSPEIIPVMFDTPLRLEPDTVYHWTACTSGGNGFYGEDGGAGATVTVNHDTGVVWEFMQTRDPANNGTSPNRGVLPALYFKFPRTAQEEASLAVENLPPIDVKALALTLDRCECACALWGVRNSACSGTA